MYVRLYFEAPISNSITYKETIFNPKGKNNNNDDNKPLMERKSTGTLKYQIMKYENKNATNAMNDCVQSVYL